MEQRTAYMHSLINKMKELPELEKNLYDKVHSDSNLYAMINQDDFNKQIYEYGVKNKVDGRPLA